MTTIQKLVLACAALAATIAEAALTPGSVFVYRVGDGSTPLTQASAPVFIDQYATDGTLIASYPAPTTSAAGWPLTAAGTANNDGQITLSADGRFIVLTGYGIAPGSRDDFLSFYDSSTVPRLIALLDQSGSFNIIQTQGLAYTFGNIHGAASLDGSQFWASGYGFAPPGNESSGPLRQGAWFIGGSGFDVAQIFSFPRDTGAIGIFNSQLYVFGGGQLLVTTPALPMSSGSSVASLWPEFSSAWTFRDAATAYASNGANGHLEKRQLVGGTWTTGSFSVSAYPAALSGYPLGPDSGYRMFFVTDGTTLFTTVDDDVNVAPPVSALATAPANTAFRGVVAIPAVAPQFTMMFIPAHATVGQVVALHYLFSNPNAASIDITMADAVPAGLAFAGNVQTTCGGGFAVTSNVLNVSTSLGPGESCQGSIDLLASAAGVTVHDAAISSTAGPASDQSTLVVTAAPYDFNGDGAPDLVWSNTTDGSTYVWYMGGTPPALITDAFIAQIDPSWKIQGIADFNGDGHPDLVWRNTSSGGCYVWYMSGTTFMSDAFLFELVPQWVIQGIADFNGDGHPDFLMRNTDPASGVAFAWYFNDANPIGDQFLFGIDPVWKVEAVGDINGDGQPDLLFRNSDPASGLSFAWFTQYSGGVLSLAGSTPPLYSIDPVWEVVQLADWNGDGKPDLLFRNATTGVVFVWYVNTDNTLGGSDFIIQIDPSWEIVPRR